LSATDVSQAAGILMRVQQMKAMKQKQNQGMTQEQYRQYQEYQEQQQGGQGQQPAQPTYQELVDQRNQAIAQAIINANAHSLVTTNERTESSQNSQQTSSSPQAQQRSAAPTGPATVKEEVDLSEVWKKLDKKSTVWTLLIDDQAKVLTVSEYIDRFQKQGAKISAPPMHYVALIDQIATQSPQMLDRPFGEVLQILAIVDYDFDNGIDKDSLAKAVLGEAGYETNKKRFNQQ